VVSINTCVMSTSEEKADSNTEEVEVGGQTFDVPKAGSTVEDPPDGGVRAWLMVALCSFISFLLELIAYLVAFSFTSKMKEDTGFEDEDEPDDIYFNYRDLIDAYGRQVYS